MTLEVRAGNDGRGPAATVRVRNGAGDRIVRTYAGEHAIGQAARFGGEALEQADAKPETLLIAIPRSRWEWGSPWLHNGGKHRHTDHPRPSTLEWECLAAGIPTTYLHEGIGLAELRARLGATARAVPKSVESEWDDQEARNPIPATGAAEPQLLDPTTGCGCALGWACLAMGVPAKHLVGRDTLRSVSAAMETHGDRVPDGVRAIRDDSGKENAIVFANDGRFPDEPDAIARSLAEGAVIRAGREAGLGFVFATE